MTTVATLDTVMRLNSTAFRQGMVQAAAQANRSLGAIQKQATETASVLLQMKRAAGAAGSLYLVKQGFDGLVNAQKQLQAIHYTFQAATGSATQAGEAMRFVRKEAADIGLVLPDSAEGFAKLSASATAAGVAMKDQTELFDAYAKASTTLHLSTTQSNRALLALEQMFAKGKIQAQELRLQLGQAVPGAAARFQNAVMEMTKGTDLAGKSFDQLLEAGALTTSRFLPALVTALRESGRGWEDASHGLQAELNRLQTAWFNLKTEVSGGLFNDAVTVGARTLADNLGAVANAISLIGASTLARVVGGALASGAGKAQRLAQEVAGSRMAATAERERAEAQMAAARTPQEEAAAEVVKTQKVLTSTKAVQGQAQAERDRAAAAYASARAAKVAADADVARLAGSTLPAATRFSAERAAASAAAQAALVKAERQYTAAMAAGNVTREQALALESTLNKARINATAAADALTAAEARLAAMREAEIAANSLSAAVGRTAKSFGNFALSLVGGPWGAAVLAIGGLAYAFYSVGKASEDYRRETSDQVKSMQALQASVKAAADEYGRLGSHLTLSQATDTLGGASEELRKKREELDGLRQEASKLQAVLAANPGNTQNSIANAFSERKLADITDRIKQLEAELLPAENATAALSDALRARLTPAVDGLKAAVQRLQEGGTILDAIKALASPEDVAAGVASIEHAQQLANGALDAMTSLGDKARKDLLTKGKTRVDQLQAELAVAQANIRAQRLGAEREAAALKAAQAAYDKNLPDARKADVADAAKKNAGAVNQQAEAYKSLKAQINSRIEQDKEAAASTDGLTAAQKLQIKVEEEFKQGKTKLSAEQQAYIRALLATAVAQGETTRAAVLQRDADKSLLDLERQLTEQAEQRASVNARQLEGMGHGQQWNEQQHGIEQIQDAYRRMRVEADKAYEAQKALHGSSAILDNQHAQAIGKITAAEQEAIVAQRQFYADQQALQDDWRVGARAAMEDWSDAAKNNADIAKTAVASWSSSAADSLAEFALNGKNTFADFTNSVVRDLARIAYQKAIAGVFDSVLGTGFGLGTGAAKGASVDSWGGYDWSSFGSSSSSSYSLAGGRAGGGPVGPGRMYEVAEGNRPELLTSDGRTYLMMGANGGHVTPAHPGSGSGSASVGDVYVTVENNVAPAQASVQQSRDSNGNLNIKVLLNAVEDHMAKSIAGGKLGKAGQQHYGWQRRGVPVGG